MRRTNDTHYRGPLAGLSAGAAVVLVGGILILVAARRQLGEVATVVAWALMATVVGAVLAAAVYVFLWLRHRALNPEILAGRHVIRAEVVDEATARPAVEAAQPAAIEPPRVYLNVTPEQLAAIIRDHTEEK